VTEQPETDEQRADRLETERAHNEGEHAFCGTTCKVEMPSDMLRNFILAKGYPGTAGALDELLRRARERAEQAEAAVERVRELHQRWDADPGSCAHCVDGRGTPLSYPCPTIRALDSQEQPVTTEAGK
jgi:hypothetical protein